MKEALLTGATGFLGSHCLKPLLDRGFKIWAVSSKPQTAIIEGVKWIHLDLKDRSGVTKLLSEIHPTHLLHLAWYAEPPHYWTSYENIEWLEASLHLIHAFLQSGGKRIVTAGTCAEYEWLDPICSESTTPCRPDSLYGTAKLSLTLLGQKLAHLFGQSFAQGRLFHLYGPQDNPKKLVRSVIAGLLKGAEVPCSNGEQTRDYLYIGDAADAMAALLDSACAGPVNIGSGQPVKIKEILIKITEKIRRENLLKLGALPVRAADPAILVPCTKRLQNEVAWKPKFNLDAGIDQTIAWVNNSRL